MISRHFLTFFALLDAGGIFSRLRYWASNNSCIQYLEVEKKGQKRLLESKDELFLMLVRLRVNILENVLADNYKISVAEGIQNLCHLAGFDLLQQLPIWASKNAIQEPMLLTFSPKVPIH